MDMRRFLVQRKEENIKSLGPLMSSITREVVNVSMPRRNISYLSAELEPAVSVLRDSFSALVLFTYLQISVPESSESLGTEKQGIFH